MTEPHHIEGGANGLTKVAVPVPVPQTHLGKASWIASSIASSQPLLVNGRGVKNATKPQAFKYCPFEHRCAVTEDDELVMTMRGININ